MNIWIAGRDKPHRCPECWWVNPHVTGWRKWLPRRCDRSCGAITLTTWPRKCWGTRCWPKGRNRDA